MLLSASASAHHPSGGAGLGETGPVRTISASTLQHDKWALALQSEFIDFDAFSDSELKEIAQSGSDVHSVDSIFHTIFSMGYGITDDLTLSLKVPYVVLNNIKEAHKDEPDEVHIHGDSKGIGDLTIFSQYRFLKMYDLNIESSLIFGLRIPFGRTKARDIDGERFETEFQPGSGSWNPLVGLAATKRFEKMSLDADVLYTIATKGAQETDLGDLFNYDLALSYRVFNRPVVWDLIVEANGEWKQKQKIDGVKDKNSGETVIFLSPAMRFSWSRKWSAYLSAGFPVVQNLNGDQNETNMRALIGISLGL
ncbi:MAG: transporter [Nitrospirae bacterium]|nr:transporter [Nitrospirota bacterium]